MIRKVITCDYFLNVCLTISVENTNRYIPGQNVFFILELNLFYVIGLKKLIKLKLEFVVSIVLIIWFVLYTKSNFN